MLRGRVDEICLVFMSLKALVFLEFIEFIEFVEVWVYGFVVHSLIKRSERCCAGCFISSF